MVVEHKPMVVGTNLFLLEQIIGCGKQIIGCGNYGKNNKNEGEEQISRCKIKLHSKRQMSTP
jgi:hypothetical protein